MTEQKKDVIHVVISSLTEPPYAERHVRWCERGGLNHPYSIGNGSAVSQKISFRTGPVSGR